LDFLPHRRRFSAALSILAKKRAARISQVCCPCRRLPHCGKADSCLAAAGLHQPCGQKSKGDRPISGKRNLERLQPHHRQAGAL